MASFFRRASRYAVGGAVDARENRLTEIFGSVLERVPELARELGFRWLGEPLEGAEVVVTTQLATPTRGIVDLEMRFRREGELPAVVWIENKHGAALHGEQLPHYLRDLTQLPHSAAVLVLLAPSQSIPDGIPEGVRLDIWQDVARLVRRTLRRNDDRPVNRWLLKEFHHYLEEESLTDEGPLRAEHVIALAQVLPADRLLSRLLDLVDARLEQEWGPCVDRNKQGTPTRSMWRNYSPSRAGHTPDPSWGDAVFELTLRRDGDLVEEPRDAYVFGAGATYLSQEHAPAGRPGGQEWIAALGAKGFEFPDDGYPRVFRFIYTDRLLAADSLDGQARILGDWTLETFKDLATTPPPSA